MQDETKDALKLFATSGIATVFFVETFMVCFGWVDRLRGAILIACAFALFACAVHFWYRKPVEDNQRRDERLAKELDDFFESWSHDNRHD